MIEERAQVVAIENDYACLFVERQTGCDGCIANKGCGTSVFSKVIGKRFVHVSVPNTLGAKVGDTVIIAVNDDVVLQGSLMAYLVPLMNLLSGALLADAFFSHEWQTILGAVLGLLLGLVFLMVFSRLKQQWFRPEMVAIDLNVTMHFSGQLLS